jgi:hypothetical protein
MKNILVDSVALFDAAFYNTTQLGNLACHNLVSSDNEQGIFHNFITTEYAIINAASLLAKYGEDANLNRSTDRRLRKEFAEVIKPYMTNYKNRYEVYRVQDVNEMMLIGEMFDDLGRLYPLEETIFAYLATRTYHGAHIMGLASEAYVDCKIPMYFSFPTDEDVS